MACKTTQNAETEIFEQTLSDNYILPEETNFNIDLNTEAGKNGTSKSCVALSLLICKLDNSQTYENLIKQNAKELFSHLCEASAKANITLETINEKYLLAEILSDEDIFVEISSNSVTHLDKKPTRLKNSWYDEFINAINS